MIIPSESEIQVLMAIYSVIDAEENVNLRSVRKTVNEMYGKEWKDQTVSTFLKRLRDKGYLDFHRTGRVFCYECRYTKMQFEEIYIKHVNELVFRGSNDKVVIKRMSKVKSDTKSA